jgi:predicted nucleotide-binding protein (sugar kinase/HSP70/actin superfamily)
MARRRAEEGPLTGRRHDGSLFSTGLSLVLLRGSTLSERRIHNLLSQRRRRLEEELGLKVRHFRRPEEGRFRASERATTTILLGGLNPLHDRLVKAAFQNCGYRCENVPDPDSEAFELGYRYCSAGQCNPLYFTAGSLIKYLRGLVEREGLSKREVCDRYVYYFVRSCGPCRFGMYEADYRRALKHAGFEGFRILPFELRQGVSQENRDGLVYTQDLGFGVLKALLLGDVLRDLACQIRPFEIRKGETDRVLGECHDRIFNFLRDFRSFALQDGNGGRIASLLAKNRGLWRTANLLGKVVNHLYGSEWRALLTDCRKSIGRIEVDRLRVKPVVKLTGELFAHLTEGPGNYDMFSFLEGEGAQVFPDPVGCMVTHLVYQQKAAWLSRAPVLEGRGDHGVGRRVGRAARRWRLWKRAAPLSFAEWMYRHQYKRQVRALGGLAHELVAQEAFAELARPFYHPLLRGGEAHLEVGKSIYYTTQNMCHMVLSVKPFGCMPSVQSDGVQGAVMECYRNLTFLSIETSGEGAVLAQSRAQMALGEARLKAAREFDRTLKATGRTREAVRAFLGRNPRLKGALYPVPRRPGLTGVAANFVSHVDDLMAGRRRFAG